MYDLYSVVPPSEQQETKEEPTVKKMDEKVHLAEDGVGITHIIIR